MKCKNNVGFCMLVLMVILLLVPFNVSAGAKPEKEEEAPVAAKEPAAPKTRFNEAPMLAELVNAGKLPSVDERLPKEPFVRQVAIEIGDYGGTMRRVSTNFRDYGTFFAQCEMPGLVQIPMDLDWHLKNGGPVAGFEPKYAEWYRWSEEGKKLTIKLREGVRWSDGHPITAEDMIWAFEQVHAHKGYSGDAISWQAGFWGDYFTMERIDDLTVSFFVPGGPWVGQVRETLERYPLPAHFLKKYHPDFTEGKTWDDLRDALSMWKTPELPNMLPWVIKEADETTGTLWERNPYYAVVDPEGNQLPYIDYIKVTPVPDAEARYLMVMQGEVDIGGADYGDLSKHAVLKDRAAHGNYDVLIWKGSRQASNMLVIWPYGQDENLAKAHSNNKFRQAISVGIDRNELNEKLFLGLATPSVSGVPPESSIYDPIQDTWLGPDKKKAWELFAEIGIKDQDGDGILQYEDGKDVHIIVPAAATEPMNIATVEALTAELSKLGIKTTMFTADWGTIGDKVYGGEITCWVHTGIPEGVPFHYLGTAHSPMIQRRGTTRPQPPEWDRLHELERAVAGSSTVDAQVKAAKAFFNYIATEGLSWTHFVTNRPQQVIRHKRMGNVPDVRIFQKFMMTAKSDQFFIRKEWQGRK